MCDEKADRAARPLLNYWKPRRVLLAAGIFRTDGTMMRLKTGGMFGQTAALVLTAALLWPAPVDAQQANDGISNFLGNIFKPGTNAQHPPAAPGAGPASGPLPWTGEDGASGHPLMTAAAIREAA